MIKATLFHSLFSLFFFLACSKSIPAVDIKYAYPDLQEQRAALTNKPYAQPVRLLDSLQIIKDLEFFASDICEGRKGGSAGHEKALQRILNTFRNAGVDSFDHSLVQEITTGKPGKNIVGWVKGTTYPDKYIVVSAHYDHLGKNWLGNVYYGADDNASGTACLLALANYFKRHPHSYSIVFAAFDQEEIGLKGAYYFVNKWAVVSRLSSVVFNLNLDMIARSDQNEIFACGIQQHPSFKYLVDSVQHQTNVKVLMGHDGGSSGENWLESSDHAAFYKKNIPFLYIGVEDHADYHKVSDTYSRVNYHRYIENCNLILSLLRLLKP